MSDDEGGCKGKGKKGKGDGRREGGGGGGKSAGGKSGKGGKGDRDGGGGPSVSRLKVVPKFIQEMQARLKPTEAKRGLDHAELGDKFSVLGRCEDDEYDLEAAQIVDSDFSLETVRAFQSKRKSAEASPPQEEAPAGPMRFRGRAERGASTASGAGRPGDDPGKGAREGKEPASQNRGGSADKASVVAGRRPSRPARAAAAGQSGSEDESGDRPHAGAKGRASSAALSVAGAAARKAPGLAKRQRLSFEEDDGG